MAFRRRRRRFSRRRRTGGVRRARRVIKRIKRRRLKRSRRKQRAKAYLWGYSFANHMDCPAGAITIGTPDGVLPAGRDGLFAYDDANELFQQVKIPDDYAYPGMTTQGWKAGRQNLTIRARGEITYTVSNGNQAGAAWLEVYICKPRKGIQAQGVGNSNNYKASDVLNNNKANAFTNDWNDAGAITIDAGTSAITNTTSQSKPTIDDSAYFVTPYMVPPFTENWKVVKQLKYVLPPGGQCMFKLKTRFLRIDRQAYQLKGTAGGLGSSFGFYRPYFGKEVFFRWHGQPCHDATSHSKVNYGPAVLDLVGVKRYWYSHSLRPLPSYVAVGSVNQTLPITAHLPALPPQEVKEDQ